MVAMGGNAAWGRHLVYGTWGTTRGHRTSCRVVGHGGHFDRSSHARSRTLAMRTAVKTARRVGELSQPRLAQWLLFRHVMQARDSTLTTCSGSSLLRQRVRVCIDMEIGCNPCFGLLSRRSQAGSHARCAACTGPVRTGNPLNLYELGAATANRPGLTPAAQVACIAETGASAIRWMRAPAATPVGESP